MEVKSALNLCALTQVNLWESQSVQTTAIIGKTQVWPWAQFIRGPRWTVSLSLESLVLSMP